MAHAFQLRCLGGPSLLSAAGEQVRFRTRKHFALLVRLALEPGKRFTRDYLTDLLWPDAAPRLANHSLAQGLSVIKAKVAREAVLIQRATVGWRSQPAGGSLPQDDPDVQPLVGFEPDIQVNSGSYQASSNGVPVIIDNTADLGRAVYLNLAMHNYGRYRLTPPAGDAYRNLFAAILAGSGILPAVQVIDPENGSPVDCVEVWRYAGDDGQYVAVMRNPEFNAASLKPAGYTGNSAIEQTVHIQVLINNQVLGEADLDPWSPLILKAP